MGRCRHIADCDGDDYQHLCLDVEYLFMHYLLLIQSMIIQSRSFLLPESPKILTSHPNITKITYFSDCVFNPHIFDISYKVEAASEAELTNKVQKLYRIHMDFNFLVKATQQHPKILDNIGIINFYIDETQNKADIAVEGDVKKQNDLLRVGVLVTNQNNGDIFVSLIQ